MRRPDVLDIPRHTPRRTRTRLKSDPWARTTRLGQRTPIAASVMPLTDLAADLGDRITHVWIRHDGARNSTLDLLGPGLTLLTVEYGGIWRHALPIMVATIATHIIDEAAAEVLGMRGGGAVLVRPTPSRSLLDGGCAGPRQCHGLPPSHVWRCEPPSRRHRPGSAPWPARRSQSPGNR